MNSIGPMNFFRTADTTGTTDKTIWKPGLSIVYIFSWDLQRERNWKQCLCKILERQTKSIMVFLILANYKVFKICDAMATTTPQILHI